MLRISIKNVNHATTRNEQTTRLSDQTHQPNNLTFFSDDEGKKLLLLPLLPGGTVLLRMKVLVRVCMGQKYALVLYYYAVMMMG